MLLDCLAGDVANACVSPMSTASEMRPSLASIIHSNALRRTHPYTYAPRFTHTTILPHRKEFRRVSALSLAVLSYTLQAAPDFAVHRRRLPRPSVMTTWIRLMKRFKVCDMLITNRDDRYALFPLSLSFMSSIHFGPIFSSRNTGHEHRWVAI